MEAIFRKEFCGEMGHGRLERGKTRLIVGLPHFCWILTARDNSARTPNTPPPQPPPPPPPPF